MKKTRTRSKNVNLLKKQSGFGRHFPYCGIKYPYNCADAHMAERGDREDTFEKGNAGDVERTDKMRRGSCDWIL